MFIVFANQKGGVGKSTLALLFAVYLGKMGISTRILDCDKQQSIYHKYLEDLVIAGIPVDLEYALSREAEEDEDFDLPVNPQSQFHIERLPFDVLSYSISYTLQQGNTSLEDPEHQVNILDMPGQLNVEQMRPIFQLADVIVTPTAFTEFDNSSTLDFARQINEMNLRARKIIVPNNINPSASYPNRMAEEARYRSMGYVITPDVGKTVKLTRSLSTMYIHPVVQAVVESAFMYIIKMLGLS